MLKVAKHAAFSGKKSNKSNDSYSIADKQSTSADFDCFCYTLRFSFVSPVILLISEISIPFIVPDIKIEVICEQILVLLGIENSPESEVRHNVIP